MNSAFEEVTVVLKSYNAAARLLCGTWWDAPLMIAKTTPL
jgi:hypothetical protein